MKITPKHYADLLALLALPGSLARQAKASEYKTQGLSKIRFAWDCILAIPNATTQPWFCAVYVYANDLNIQTALFKALGEVYDAHTEEKQA